MSYGTQQHTSLWSPEVYALESARYVGCVVRDDYCGPSDRQGWPQAQLAARPCLVWRLLTH